MGPGNLAFVEPRINYSGAKKDQQVFFGSISRLKVPLVAHSFPVGLGSLD